MYSKRVNDIVTISVIDVVNAVDNFHAEIVDCDEDQKRFYVDLYQIASCLAYRSSEAAQLWLDGLKNDQNYKPFYLAAFQEFIDMENAGVLKRFHKDNTVLFSILRYYLMNSIVLR